MVPRAGSHPFKRRLQAWYSRLGYRLAGRHEFEVESLCGLLLEPAYACRERSGFCGLAGDETQEADAPVVVDDIAAHRMTASKSPTRPRGRFAITNDRNT